MAAWRTVSSLLWVAAFIDQSVASTTMSTRSLQQQSVVASSPFTMTLAPTPEPLDATALEVLEGLLGDTLSESLLLLEQLSAQINIFDFRNVEILLQGSEFRPDLDATDLRFFALVSTNSDDFAVDDLNAVMQETFTDPVIQEQLLQDFQSSSSAQLQAIDSIEVSSLESGQPQGKGRTDGSPSTSSSSDDRKLSTLDIVLIVISGCIFLGIVYMILQHHWDRGWLDNQRIRAANRRDDFPEDGEDEEEQIEPPVITFLETVQDKEQIDQLHRDASDQPDSVIHLQYSPEAPSTPSTTSDSAAAAAAAAAAATEGNVIVAPSLLLSLVEDASSESLDIEEGVSVYSTESEEDEEEDAPALEARESRDDLSVQEGDAEEASVRTTPETKDGVVIVANNDAPALLSVEEQCDGEPGDYGEIERFNPLTLENEPVFLDEKGDIAALTVEETNGVECFKPLTLENEPVFLDEKGEIVTPEAEKGTHKPVLILPQDDKGGEERATTSVSTPDLVSVGTSVESHRSHKLSLRSIAEASSMAASRGGDKISLKSFTDEDMEESSDTKGDQRLSESFDNKWFGPNALTKQRSRTKSTETSTANSENNKQDVSEVQGVNDEDYDASSSSSSSEDVFNVDVEASDSGAKRSKSNSQISEWMKSIRVVSVGSGSKASSVTTSSSHDHASTSSAPPSLSSQPSLKSLAVSSLEARSLEQSMASSTISAPAGVILEAATSNEEDL